MTFVEEKFIPSGDYNIINARQDLSIIRSDDDGERLTASTNDDHVVSKNLFAIYEILRFSLDPVVGYFAGR